MIQSLSSYPDPPVYQPNAIVTTRAVYHKTPSAKSVFSFGARLVPAALRLTGSLSAAFGGGTTVRQCFGGPYDIPKRIVAGIVPGPWPDDVSL